MLRMDAFFFFLNAEGKNIRIRVEGAQGNLSEKKNVMFHPSLEDLRGARSFLVAAIYLPNHLLVFLCRLF